MGEGSLVFLKFAFHTGPINGIISVCLSHTQKCNFVKRLRMQRRFTGKREGRRRFPKRSEVLLTRGHAGKSLVVGTSTGLRGSLRKFVRKIMSVRNPVPEHRTTGAVFTRPEVVSYMMREVMRAGRFGKWRGLSVLEPSCGDGAFVLPIVNALIAEEPDWEDDALEGFLLAFDVSEKSISHVKREVAARLDSAGCSKNVVKRLLSCWFRCEDFLLHDFQKRFDVVIGNPPYIRFDNIAPEKQRAYKVRYDTFSERCDIYVPFFERSLSLLSPRGVFSFICTNRFVRSSYGRRLRRMISESFHVALYLNMEHTQPFETEVSAYPAIYVIDRHIGKDTYSGEVASLDDDALRHYRTGVAGSRLNRFVKWYGGEDAWVTTDSAERERFESITSSFPTIEQSGAGTLVGIGVASGADEIYVDPQRNTEIEASCLLPLVASEDIQGGSIEWNSRYMLNPYDQHDDRQMLDLSKFPKTGAYLEKHAGRLKARYCAKKHPDSWYRTLDRISYRVLRAEKLLLPDIQRGGNVALDERGQFYPHHNVYWITSDTWNMRALCVLMRSSFVTEQIRRVSVQMRGGSIRYQAQNLRHVHIPAWSSLDEADVTALAGLYGESDVARVDRLVESLLVKVVGRQPKKLVAQEFDFAV